MEQERRAQAAKEVALEMPQLRGSSRNSRSDKPFAQAKDAETQRNTREGRNSKGCGLIPADPGLDSDVCPSGEGATDQIEAEGEASCPEDHEVHIVNQDPCLFDYQKESKSTVILMEEPLEHEFASNNYWHIEHPFDPASVVRDFA